MKPEDYSRKILLDECIDYGVLRNFRERGFTAVVHARDTDLFSHTDQVIFEYARENGMFVITADEKFFRKLQKYLPGKAVYAPNRSEYEDILSNKTVANRAMEELKKKFKQARQSEAVMQIVEMKNG